MRLLRGFMISILLVQCGCDSLDGLDEGDRNTYTWKGIIYEGYSDVPLKNRPVYLEVAYPGVPSGDVEILGETTTDEHGYYSITYRKIRRPTEGLSLYIENGQFSNLPKYSAPVNKDVIRDIAETDHARIFVIIESNTKIDSIYLGIPLLIDDQPEIIGMKMPGASGTFKVAKFHPNQNKTSILLKSELVLGNSESANNMALAYGLDKSTFQKAFTAVTNDSVSNDFNRIEFTSAGFPVTDTIHISI